MKCICKKWCKILRDQKFYAKFKKCEILLDKVAFLGHVISNDGISVDCPKIEAIVNWPRPTTVTKVRSFLQLARNYWKFVQNFSKIVEPLTELTRKGEQFVWSDKREKSLQDLKDRLTTASTLML